MQPRELWELDGYQNQIKSTTTFYTNEIGFFVKADFAGTSPTSVVQACFGSSFRDNRQLAHGLTRDPGCLNGGGFSPTGGGHTSMFHLKMVDCFRDSLKRGLRLKIRIFF